LNFGSNQKVFISASSDSLLKVLDFYVVSVWNWKYVFKQDTQSFVLSEAIENVNFTATL